jgi:hypothetical protein
MHSGYYDDEIIMTLDASNPWFIDWNTTPVRMYSWMTRSVYLPFSVC